MKICIVIQSDAFRASAGMRIRYDRFRECLSDPDVTIDDMTSADLAAAGSFDHDVYIFCKTFDTPALLLARRIRAAGKIVGQDLFDDYFSQHDDPRLARFREWLADMAPVTHFAVCSTPRMVDVLQPYMPGIRITSIDDPIVGFDTAKVASLAATKAARARETNRIEVVWFGIGDNPYFPVGLHDLIACDAELAALQQLGWQVLLRVVTNRRALDGGGADLLRRLSVEFEIIEWTEEAETEALQRATLAILPVSGQSFSRAKSLNRAVTALDGGCQVLSVGYPLYQRLDSFIYRRGDDFHADLTSDRLRVRPATIDALNAMLESLASPREAVDAFVREARLAVSGRTQKAKSAPAAAPTICLIHGRNSTIGIHKAVSAIKGLSIGTPFTRAAWNFPVRFDIVDRQLAMRSTPAIARRYALPVQGDQLVKIRDLEFVTIDTAALGLAPLPLHVRPTAAPIEDLAVYEDIMRVAQAACRAAFAPVDILVSDSSPMRPHRRSQLKSVEAAEQRGMVSDPALAGASDIVAGDLGTARRRRPTDAAPPAKPRWMRFVGGKDATRQRDLRLIAESGLFDRDWYLAEYPDVASSGIAPDRHFLEFGWREGRDPGPHFSTKAYLKAHMDVAAQDVNPLLHYAAHGEAEGRRISPSLRARGRTRSTE